MTDYLHRSILSEVDAIASVYDELTVWSSRFGNLLLLFSRATCRARR